jgi:pimeloyl-ACP methyl ester carboxylesterase
MAVLTLSVLGQPLAVEERGEGPTSAPAALLVHGLTGDRAVMIAAFDELLAEAGVRRLYVDLPGHGASPGNAAAASADALVDALAVLLGELGGSPPLLVGYAYGGYLVQGLLAACPVAGALLVCPVVEPEFPRRRCPPRHVARRQAALVFADDPQEQVTFEEVAVVQTAAVLSAYRQQILPASRAVDRAFVEAVRGRYAMARPYLEALSRVEAAVSIVCGRHDHWVGFEDAARLVAALPAGELEVVASCGNLLPLEQPARLRRAAQAWLARALAVG